MNSPVSKAGWLPTKNNYNNAIGKKIRAKKYCNNKSNQEN